MTRVLLQLSSGSVPEGRDRLRTSILYPIEERNWILLVVKSLKILRTRSFFYQDLSLSWLSGEKDDINNISEFRIDEPEDKKLIQIILNFFSKFKIPWSSKYSLRCPFVAFMIMFSNQFYTDNLFCSQ